METEKQEWNGHYNPFHCPVCYKFVSKVTATRDGFGQIVKIIGKCKRHGSVDIINSSAWDNDDFED